MKSRLAVLLVSVFAICQSFTVFAQTTAFTYQGRLLVTGSPANGLFDIKFSPFSAGTNGSSLGNPITNYGIQVVNGIFSTKINFGTTIFTGGDVWLEIAVSPYLANTFNTLSPRQQITPAPYGLYSAFSGTSAAQSNSLYKSLVVDSNGVVVSPANFFTANSNQLNSYLSSAIPSSVGNFPVANQTNGGVLTADDFIAIRYKPSGFYQGPPMTINTWPNDGNNQGSEYGGDWPVGFVQHVQQLNASGLRNLGFDTVVIDGGWLGYRDPVTGQLHENASVWPDGLSNTVRWAHSLGIKVGLWHSLGLTTNVGMGYQQGWQEQFTYFGTNWWAGNTNWMTQLFPPGFSNDQLIVKDATWFAQMGIDYVKLEMGTNSLFNDAQEAASTRLFYQTMINNGKRPYIMSAVGTDCAQPWMNGLINAERNGGFDMPNAGVGISCWYQFLNNFFWAAQHPEMSGPGNYISTDILPANYANVSQQGAMLLMAAMLSSELCISGTNFPPAFNENIIALDQDPAAIMARTVYSNVNMTVWTKPLTSPLPGTFATMFLNTGSSAASFTVTNPATLGSTNSQMLCLDLVSNITTVISNNWTVTVPGQMAYGFKLWPIHTSY